MFPTLPTAVDNLAANGIIDFDADAFIKGTAPRYVGAPKTYLPFEEPLPAHHQPAHGEGAPQIHHQPKHDEFVHGEKDSGWKKALVAGSLLALVAAVGYRFKSNPRVAKVVDSIKPATEKTTGFFKGLKDKFVNIFSSKQAPAPKP